jgi:hypothetical protein
MFLTIEKPIYANFSLIAGGKDMFFLIKGQTDSLFFSTRLKACSPGSYLFNGIGLAGFPSK